MDTKLGTLQIFEMVKQHIKKENEYFEKKTKAKKPRKKRNFTEEQRATMLENLRRGRETQKRRRQAKAQQTTGEMPVKEPPQPQVSQTPQPQVPQTPPAEVSQTPPPQVSQTQDIPETPIRCKGGRWF